MLTVAAFPKKVRFEVLVMYRPPEIFKVEVPRSRERKLPLSLDRLPKSQIRLFVLKAPLVKDIDPVRGRSWKVHPPPIPLNSKFPKVLPEKVIV